jgi:hypothetical protein
MNIADNGSNHTCFEFRNDLYSSFIDDASVNNGDGVERQAHAITAGRVLETPSHGQPDIFKSLVFG